MLIPLILNKKITNPYIEFIIDYIGNFYMRFKPYDTYQELLNLSDLSTFSSFSLIVKNLEKQEEKFIKVLDNIENLFDNLPEEDKNYINGFIKILERLSTEKSDPNLELKALLHKHLLFDNYEFVITLLNSELKIWKLENENYKRIKSYDCILRKTNIHKGFYYLSNGFLLNPVTKRKGDSTYSIVEDLPFYSLVKIYGKGNKFMKLLPEKIPFLITTSEEFVKVFKDNKLVTLKRNFV
jgi:hypothetical protein